MIELFLLAVYLHPNNTLHWPLVAESGPQFCPMVTDLNVRFRGKQTLG